MSSRGDQTEAYRAGWRRLMGAVIGGDPDGPDPTRRPMRTLFVGVVVALLVLVGSAGWHYLSPGAGGSWKQPGTIVVVKGAGSRYVMYQGQLHPVLNVASALLLSQSTPKVVTVSAHAIAGTPIGWSVGIPGAPDALPATADLLTGAWSVCTSQLAQASGLLSVVIGAGGAASRPLQGASAALVTADGRTDYLLWDGHRLPVQGAAALAALGYTNDAPDQVPTSWLNLVPIGPSLGAPAVPGLGTAAPYQVGSLNRVGQVGEVQSLGTAPQYYVLLSSGLAPVSHLVAGLLLADPAIVAAYPGRAPAAIPVSITAYAAAPKAPEFGSAGLPATSPALFRSGVVCASVQPGGAGSVHLADAPTATAFAGRGPVALPSAAPGAGLAAAVYVPPGSGALVHVEGTLPTGTSRTQVVTDQGIRYPVLGTQALGRLGYSHAAGIDLPYSVLSFLPQGPTLSTSAAGRLWAVPPTGG